MEDGDATGLTLAGSDAGNYVLDSVATTTANITHEARSRAASRRDNKVYDGNSDADGADAFAGRRSSGDVLTPGRRRRASFADKNVGNGKTVTLSGVDADGRRCGQLHPRHGGRRRRPTSRRKHMTGSFTADNKVYDGNTSRRC